MCEIGRDGLVANSDEYDSESQRMTWKPMEQALLHPTDEIIFDVVKAIEAGMTVEKITSYQR